MTAGGLADGLYKVKEAKKYSTTISSTAERKVPQYVKCGIGLATK